MLVAESFASASPQSQPASLRLRSKPKSMTTTTIPTTTTSTTTSKRAAAAAASASISRAIKADFDLSTLLGETKEEEDEQQQYSFNNDTSVLHTPRRGRRVGKVDLGWDLLFPSSQQQQQSDHSLNVSPRKRKVEDDGIKLPSDANVRLVESQGRASAAIPKLANNFTFNGLDEHGSPPHSRQQSFRLPPTAVPTYDKLAGFHKEEDVLSLPVLIPVDVPLIGRMAVHRSEASQIACMDTSILFKDNSSSGSSDTSTSTRPTSTLDDAFSDPSPSFSLSSQFPASEPNSPTKAYSKHALPLVKPSAEVAIKERMQAMRNARQNVVNNILEATHSSWKPRLNGLGMPQLDWPDSPNGPWSGAGEEIRRLQEQKRRGIARWLDEDSEDESALNGTASEQQHPMVAKAMHDRARKETLIRSLSMSHLKMRKHLTPVKKSSSRRRRMKLEETSKNKGLDQKTVYLHPPPKAVGRLAGYTLSSPSNASASGCYCGSFDETSEMVQCDACNLWFHLMCIGVLQSSDLGEEWFCNGCCDIASIGLSPNSLSDRASLIATPNFPRSAAIAGQQLRLSQGQLPVFAQPSSDSPLVRGELRHQPQHALPSQPYTSALALAPSPTLPSSHHDIDRRSNSGKRHRASRIGWHQVEPGSPLERKGGPSTHHRRTTSGQLPNGQVSLVAPSPHRRRIPTLEHGKWNADFSTAAAPPRTPSPQFSHTPRSRSTNTSTRHYREFSNREPDDVFSTPSRILQGSASWGAPQWQQSSSHSTSMMRHSREDSGLAASHSTPWGLSTPTRFLDSGDLHSDYSEGHGGLPSLVYSSGGLDLADLTWQLQSPSSSTRAATRARQNTSTRKIVGQTSSARDKTPTPQNSQGKSSCASSSPFPKTPTLPDLTTMHHHHYHHHPHHPHQSPQSTPSKTLHRLSQHQLTPTNAASVTSTQYSSVYPSAKTSSQPKTRHMSSGEMMAGLGIGLDLEDVLEWA